MKPVTLILLFTITGLFSQQPPAFHWSGQIGGILNDEGRSVTSDPAGNVYSTGYFKGTVDFDPGPAVYNITSNGGMDCYISKIDSSGNFVWAKSIGGTSDDRSFSVAIDQSGNVYITGFVQGTVDMDPGSGQYIMYSSGSWDIFILKLNAAGDFQWAKRVGGNSGETGFSIILDNQSNILVTGAFSASVDFDPGPYHYYLYSAGGMDVFVLKLDTNANFLWVRKMGGASNDQGFSIASDASGNIYTTGYFYGTADFDPGSTTFNLISGGQSDVFISKLNANGDFQWAKHFSGDGYSEGSSIKTDSDGDLYLTGYFYNTADFDPGPAVHLLSSNGNADIFIARLSPSGEFIWAKEMGGPNDDRGYDLGIDSEGNIHTAGCFQGSVDFDPGTGTFYLSTPGNYYTFVHRLNPAGDFKWAGKMGGSGNTNSFGLSTDSQDNVYLTGFFEGNADLHPGAETENFNSFGGMDIFLTKLGKNTEIGPVISLKGDLDFGGVLSGCQSERILTIVNPGTDTLIVYSLTFPFPVFSGNWTGAIPPGGSQDIPILFQPEAAMNYSGEITVSSNAYSGTNSISVSGTGLDGPVNFWIGAYTHPENQPGFPAEILLGSGTTATPAVNPVKICADGSKATIIKVNCDLSALNMEDIRFKIASVDGGDPDFYGAFEESDYFSEPGMAIARFTHPNYLEEGDVFRDDQIIAYHIACPDLEVLVIPIRIYRAPMLFVHGLWGDDGSFLQMDNWFQNEFSDSNLITIRADYSADYGASKGFNENAGVIPQWIQNTLNQAVNIEQFSCGKVDIVAHSMGGVLSRLYLQSDGYRRDVHTLTTINTPHSGTQSADLLLSDKGILTWVPLYLMGNCVNCGAVRDLKIGSSFFASNLKGNEIKVPSLVYSSDSYTPDLSQDWLITGLIWAINAEFFVKHGVFLPPMLPPSLFRQEINDVIVPLSSQRGGVGLSPHFSNTVHTVSEKNPELFADLKNKLGQSPSGPYFHHDGFQKANLKMPWWSHPIFDLIPFKFMPDSVEIISPENNAIFNWGDEVSFHISRLSGNINYLACSIMNQGQAIYNVSAVDSVLQFQFTIPSDVYGEVQVLAFGFNGSGMDYDSSGFFVNINATPDSIRFQPASFLAPSNSMQKVHVNGYFSDQVVRNISLMPDIQYSVVDTNILVFTVQNTFWAKLPGQTQVIATYQGFTDTLQVEIYQGPNYYTASFSIPGNLICGSGDLQFTETSGGNPAGWEWDFPGGTPAYTTVQHPIVHYDFPGSYDVTLITHWTDKSDTLFLPSYIIVEDNPPAFITPSGPIAICQGEQITLQANAGDGYSYYWSNDSITSGIVVSEYGAFSVWVISENGCGSASDTVTVTVITPKEPAINANGPLAFCEGDSVVLTSDPAESYLWSTGETSQTITVTDPGAYSVSVVDENGCLAYSQSIAIEVFSLPLVSFTGLTEGQILDDTASAILLTGIPPEGVFEGNGIVNGNYFDPGAAGPGTHSITYTHVDSNSCSASYTITVTVNQVVSVRPLQQGDEGYEIFPNPTTGVLHIKGTGINNRPCHISLSNSLGQEVFRKDLNNQDNRLEFAFSMGGLPCGIYFLQIQTDSGRWIYSVQKL